MNIWIYSLAAVFLVSLISFSGALTLVIKKEKLKDILIYFVSFSAGALLGDVFIHILPEVIKEYNQQVSLIFILVLTGIFTSFILEKIICWRHCHLPITKNHVHNFAWMNLWGDFFHNFLDGLTIAVSFLVNIPTGIATTLAVIFHEIPQEIGDLGVLLHGGFKVSKALFLNFLTALSAVLGVIIGLALANKVEHITLFLAPFAAGNFIYIASSDLIPELHKETAIKKGFIQMLSFTLGVLVMYALLFIGE
ncbi:MAG: ZIP family metal transporter [Microgenomates group bacterium]